MTGAARARRPRHGVKMMGPLMLGILRQRVLRCCGLAAVVFVAGCPSQEQISREFRANREQSYQALYRARPDPNGVGGVVSGPLTLDKAIDLALKHNKDVQTAKLGFIEARGRTLKAASTALPTVSFTGTALLNDNTITVAGKESYNIRVLLRQPLYLGGLASAALDAAAVNTYRVKQDLRLAVQNVQFEVRRDFLAGLLTRALVKVAVQAKEDAQEHLEDTEKKLRFGVGTRFDVLRAQVRVVGLDAELIAAQNDELVAVSSLLNGMGLSQLSKVELVGSLEYAQGQVAGDEAMSVALQQRAELLIGEALIRLARDNVASERAGDRPKVYLQGGYVRDYPGFGFTRGREWFRTMGAGLIVEWPVFDGLQTVGRVTQARAELQRQQVAERKLELQVQQEVTEGLFTMESAERFLLSQQDNVANAVEALRLVQVSFREGASTSLDVISSELALAQARTDYVTAVHAYQLSKLELHAAIGTIGEQALPEVAVDPNGVVEETPEQDSGAK